MQVLHILWTFSFLTYWPALVFLFAGIDKKCLDLLRFSPLYTWWIFFSFILPFSLVSHSKICILIGSRQVSIGMLLMFNLRQFPLSEFCAPTLSPSFQCSYFVRRLYYFYSCSMFMMGILEKFLVCDISVELRK